MKLKDFDLGGRFHAADQEPKGHLQQRKSGLYGRERTADEHFIEFTE